LLLHTIFLTVISGLAGAAIFIPLAAFNVYLEPGLGMLANQLATFISITTATFLARRFLDKRSFTSLGLVPGRRAVVDILIGILITFFQMGLIFGLELALGWTTFAGFAWQFNPMPVVWGGLAAWLVVFLMVGWQEELLSRGYHLQTLESGLNLFWAVLLSSTVFGALHLGNPNANWLSTLGIVLAGIYLALPFIITRQLWLSIGLHIGWNFFEGVVFGFPVSGLTTFRLMVHNVQGPVLWTGGDFGPEAGLLLIPSLVLGSALIFAYTKFMSSARSK
jgi:membrane protease YdiL (CAAX protease family)